MMAAASLVPYIQITARAGDRWDLLAWRFYGDASLFGAIVMANPALPISGVIDAGAQVLIPILSGSSLLSNSDLPPWKRG